MSRSGVTRFVAAACTVVLLVGCRGQAERGVPVPSDGDVAYRAQLAPPASPSNYLKSAQAAVPDGVVGGSMGGRGPAAAEVEAVPPPPPPPAPSQSSAVAVPTGRKLIRDVAATLEVSSVEKAIEKLRRDAESTGGYVGSESRSRDTRGINAGAITLRLPAAKLDGFVAGLSSVGTVEQTNATANDITEEYFDLELRLNTQRQLQTRLLELLNRPGNRLSDLLETERELARVRGEIEQMEGRQRFWDNRVSLASVAVSVHEPMPVVATAAGGAWSALKHSFSEAADNFVYAIAGVIAFTGGLIPVAIALVIGLWIVTKLWKLRKRGRGRT
jgi:hypothetical protein